MTSQVPPSDQDLWSAIAAGDEIAFGQLFDRYARAVYNHAFRLTGSWTLAEGEFDHCYTDPSGTVVYGKSGNSCRPAERWSW